MAVPVEGVHEVAKAWKDMIGEPLIWLVAVLLATDLVAFLLTVSTRIEKHSQVGHQ